MTNPSQSLPTSPCREAKGLSGTETAIFFSTSPGNTQALNHLTLLSNFLHKEEPSWMSNCIWLFGHLFSWINRWGHYTEIRLCPLPCLPSPCLFFSFFLWHRSRASSDPCTKQHLENGLPFVPLLDLLSSFPCRYQILNYLVCIPQAVLRSNCFILRILKNYHKKRKPPWTHPVNSTWGWIKCLWVL